MKRFAFAAVLIACAAPVMAQTAVPPDCSKAATPVDQAVCADPQLSALDKSVRDAFVKAQGRVDKDALKALQKDQKDFMTERALVFANKAMPVEQYMQNRLAFLEKLENPAWSRDAGAFLGIWKNSLGEVRVTKDDSGKLVVSISTLSPAESKWICDIESVTDAPKNGRLTFTEDEVKVTLSRRGSALVIGDQVPEGDGGRPFCGANGYIDGAYFKVK
jgi:uncharacterized protein